MRKAIALALLAAAAALAQPGGSKINFWDQVVVPAGGATGVALAIAPNGKLALVRLDLAAFEFALEGAQWVLRIKPTAGVASREDVWDFKAAPATQVFAPSATPIPGSLVMHRNGVKQTAGIDYDVGADGKLIHKFPLTAGPEAGDLVTLNYLVAK